MRTRDFSGFFAEPAFADERTVRRRITLSLPPDAAGHLKRYAVDTRRYYLDVVLDAFVHHEASIQHEFEIASADTDVELRPLKRRNPPGRVQIPLQISPQDLAAIDQAADAVRLDRSSYVAELLRRLG